MAPQGPRYVVAGGLFCFFSAERVGAQSAAPVTEGGRVVSDLVGSALPLSQQASLATNDQSMIINNMYSHQLMIIIRGQVRSSLDNKPLHGVTVTTRQTNETAVTDENGNYMIRAARFDNLAFTFIGFDTLQIAVSKRELIDVILNSIDQAIDIIEINAGYYRVEDQFRTGNIARVAGSDIQKHAISNPILGLQGLVPGIVIQQRSGVPGAAITFQIRGQNSLRAEGNYPLYVIDGVIVSSEPIFAGNTGSLVAHGMDPLNTISPQDIESIEILKDADATAIYGSRGANGVVLITTKKYENRGKKHISVASSSGFSNVPRLKMMNTEQYLVMREEAYSDDGSKPNPLSAHDVLTWDRNRYTDWQKELIGNTAWQNQIQGAVSGTYDSGQYRISSSWKQEGMVFRGDMRHQLITVGTHVDHGDPNDRLRVSMTANYGFTQNITSPYNIIQDALTLPPNAPKLYTSDGKLNWENNTWYNPMSKLNATHSMMVDQMNTHLNLHYQLFHGLNLKLPFGYQLSYSKLAQRTPITSKLPWVANRTGDAVDGTVNGNNWLIEPQLTFKYEKNGLDIDMLLGSAFQHQSIHSFQINTGGYINDGLLGNSISAGNMRISKDDSSVYRYASIFARMGVRFMDRYVVNLSGRRDGSSRFGPGKRFGNFGAIEQRG